MNIDLKSIVFGAFLGGVFVAAVLSFVAPKSEIGRFEVMVGEDSRGYNVLLDTETGQTWYQGRLADGWTKNKIY